MTSSRYLIKFGNAYKKDIRRLKKQGADLAKLEEAIDMLASGVRLPNKYRDHELKGQLADIRECHIGPDWLLKYAKQDQTLVLLLLRTGTHRDVLGRE